MAKNGRRNGGTGEVVVITGATAGVGRATVREFTKHGARIGLIARGMDGLQATKHEVEELGGEALICQCDVAEWDQVEEAAGRVEDAFGPIDVWVNNAMTSVFAPFLEISAEEYERVTRVVYLGQVNGTRAALARMKPRDRGSIVNVGSALAYRGIPLQSAYCGGKHAIQGFTESVRTELMHDDSQVGLTQVHLPAMNTPQFEWVKSKLPKKAQPVPPIYQPEVAARAIYWAAHHKRRDVMVGFPTVKTVVGNKLAPGVADWYLARKGFSAQQTDEPREEERPSNLWEPVPGDWGAHGRFDHRARKRSPQTWMSLHKKEIGLAAAAAGLAFGAFQMLSSND